MKKLQDKVILVTGSGRGFGRGMAYSYALQGAKVVSVARTVKELKSLEDQIHSKGGEVFTVPTDLTDENAIYSLRDEVLEHYGKIDTIVNNAATSPWKILDEMTVNLWDKTIAVNLRAPFILCKAFFETMRKQGGGSIINVTSGSANRGFVAETAYCPSKFGIEGLTQCLALELQPHNIAVNSLGVGAPSGQRLKPTELTLEEAGNMPPEIRERYADDESMAEFFGEAWAFLALQDAKGVTGQRLGSRQLADYLKRNGWDAALANWRRKLTKAVYVTYDFPESVRYQTPDGRYEKYKFIF